MTSLEDAGRAPRASTQVPLARDPLLSLYLLIAACVAADLSFVPLLPSLRASRGLSGTQAALLLSAGTVAMIIAPVPLGRLADRLGAHRLLTGAGGLATVASVILATTDGFTALLVGRILIGLTNASIWTAGAALAAGRPGAVARAIGAGGAGRLAGPLLASALAGEAGTRAVFAAAAVLTLATTIIFHHADRQASPPAASESVQRAVAGPLRPALKDSSVRVAALGLLLLGFTEGAANLLAPAQLHADGLTSASIGALGTLAAGVAFATTTLARRLVERHDATLLAASAAFGLGVAWSIPAVSASVVAVASFLIAFAVARTLLNPASYLLARDGAVAAGAGTAITLGATNLLLGAGGLTGPLLASLGLAHPQLAQATIALLCLASATAIARSARRHTTGPAGRATPQQNQAPAQR